MFYRYPRFYFDGKLITVSTRAIVPLKREYRSNTRLQIEFHFLNYLETIFKLKINRTLAWFLYGRTQFVRTSRILILNSFTTSVRLALLKFSIARNIIRRNTLFTRRASLSSIFSKVLDHFLQQSVFLTSRHNENETTIEFDDLRRHEILRFVRVARQCVV